VHMTLEIVTSLSHRHHIGIRITPRRRPPCGCSSAGPALAPLGPRAIISQLFWFESHFVESLSFGIFNPCLAPHFALILQGFEDLTWFIAKDTVE
jgi:hypothetical protein